MAIEFDLNVFFKSLDLSKTKVQDGAERGIHDATDHLLRESVNLAPLDKGTLRRSAGKDVEVTDAAVIGEVFYNATEVSASGERANYALILHEMGEFKNPTTPGTQPKYLERPLKQNAERYVEMIANEVRKEMT